MKTTKKASNYSSTAGAVMSVREAKARFSALVARAADGECITITSHGRPRARIAPISADENALRVDRAWLRSMTVRPRGRRSEEIVRADRDSRA